MARHPGNPGRQATPCRHGSDMDFSNGVRRPAIRRHRSVALVRHGIRRGRFNFPHRLGNELRAVVASSSGYERSRCCLHCQRGCGHVLARRYVWDRHQVRRAWRRAQGMVVVLLWQPDTGYIVLLDVAIDWSPGDCTRTGRTVCEHAGNGCALRVATGPQWVVEPWPRDRPGNAIACCLAGPCARQLSDIHSLDRSLAAIAGHTSHSSGPIQSRRARCLCGSDFLS